jgi:hypothetical protein
MCTDAGAPHNAQVQQCKIFVRACSAVNHKVACQHVKTGQAFVPRAHAMLLRGKTKFGSVPRPLHPPLFPPASFPSLSPSLWLLSLPPSSLPPPSLSIAPAWDTVRKRSARRHKHARLRVASVASSLHPVDSLLPATHGSRVACVVAATVALVAASVAATVVATAFVVAVVAALVVAVVAFVVAVVAVVGASVSVTHTHQLQVSLEPAGTSSVSGVHAFAQSASGSICCVHQIHTGTQHSLRRRALAVDLQRESERPVRAKSTRQLSPNKEYSSTHAPQGTGCTSCTPSWYPGRAARRAGRPQCAAEAAQQSATSWSGREAGWWDGGEGKKEDASLVPKTKKKTLPLFPRLDLGPIKRTPKVDSPCTETRLGGVSTC